MSLNELVDLYNTKLNSNGSRSTLATDPSHHTPQSTFTTNTGFDAFSDPLNTNANHYSNISFTDNATSALLYDLDSSRFHLNDRILYGDIIRPPPHNPPRIERIKHTDKLQFSSGDNEVDDYEHNEEYHTNYPDVKHQLTIVNAEQAKLPPVNININPGEQIQRLIQQGKLKNFHGYVNYPYNYIEPPWYFDYSDEQQGFVNLNPPQSHLTEQDLQHDINENPDALELPYGIPQDVVCQDRYELVPLPKMVYNNYVPLVATRRIVYRRPKVDRVEAESSFYPRINTTGMASKLADVDEMIFKA